MERLIFKKEVIFESGKIYSVCLRGARRFQIGDEHDLSLYTPISDYVPQKLADIISQVQMRFCDLTDKHFVDNYDESARTYGGLMFAMQHAYSTDFSGDEIITILRFKVD